MFKYLRKKHAVSSLVLLIIIVFAFVLIMLLSGLYMQLDGMRFIVPPMLMASLVIMVLGLSLWIPAKEGNSYPNNPRDVGAKAQRIIINDLQNEKKYFASILSHDLRSPLSSIILLASYLKSKNEHPEINQYIDLIEQSARKELEMMATLLSLMRADRSNPENLEEFNLKSLAEQIILSAESQLSRKMLKTKLLVPSQATVVADPSIFLLIFKSLINQAIQYSDPEQDIDIIFSEMENRITIELSIKSQELPKVINEDLVTSDRLTSQSAVNGFPDCIDLYFSQQALNNYNGTIRVQADGNGPECRFIMTLDRLTTPHIV